MGSGVGKVAKIAAPIALGIAAPYMLPAIGLTAPTTALGTMGLGALTGGIGSAITGQNPLQGALLGGLGSGIGQGFGSMFGGASDAAAGAISGATNAAAPIQGLGQIAVSNLAAPAVSSVAQTGVPQVATGIGDLLSSKYAVPALVGGASLLSGSGKQKQLPSPSNRLPAHDVAALDRTQQDVDSDVYYGVGGNRNHFKPYSSDVVMAANGGSIRKYAQGGEVPMGNNLRPMEGAALPGNSRQTVEGVVSALAEALSPTPNKAAPIAPLQRSFTQVDPSVYYGIGGNRAYFSPVAVDAPNVVKPAALAKGGRLVQGEGDGTSDDIPAMLSDGEYVIPAAAVSALGNGSNKAGAKKLDAFKQNILNKHYKKGSLPKAAGIGSYMRAA